LEKTSESPVSQSGSLSPAFFRDSRVLIVGGSGFIGSHLATFFKNGGASVTTLGLKKQPSCAVDQALQVDLAQREEVRAALSNSSFEFVINASGYIQHTLFARGGRSVLDVHFAGLLNVIENLDRGRLRAFVQIGSSDEYGGNPSPQDEERRESPISPYSVAKVSADHFLQMLFRTEEFPAIIVRLFLVYGPGQDQGRFIPQVARGFLADENVNLSAGEQLRDFTYVDDIVRGIALAATVPEAFGQVINLASGEPVAVKEVVEILAKLIGKGCPKYGVINYRVGENMRLYASVEKAKRILNWSPIIPLRQGLELTVSGLSNSKTAQD
jgi:UDP-glucose 4-epimerase